MVVYTYVYQMLAPPKDFEEIVEAEKAPALKGDHANGTSEALSSHPNGLSTGNDLTAPLLLTSGKQNKVSSYPIPCASFSDGSP